MDKSHLSWQIWFWDLLAVLPGGLLIASIAPSGALIFALPVALYLIGLRQMVWREVPIAGRFAIGLLCPVVSGLLALSLLFGRIGLFAGLLIAGGLIGCVELWHRFFRRTLVQRFPLFVTLSVLLAGTVFNFVLLEDHRIYLPTEDVVNLFNRAPTPPHWDSPVKKQAVQSVRTVLHRNAYRPAAQQRLYEELAPALPTLVAAPTPAEIYVTLYNRSGYRSRGASTNRGNALKKLLQATADAATGTARLPRSPSTAPPPWSARANDTNIQIDVAGAAIPIPRRQFIHWFAPWLMPPQRGPAIPSLGRLVDLSYDIEPGVDGLQIGLAKRTAVVLPTDPLTNGWLTAERRAKPLRIRTSILRQWKKQHNTNFENEQIDQPFDAAEYRKFRTTSFGQLGRNTKILDWYRANVLFDGDLRREVLVERTIVAADWLSRQVKPNGAFHYEIRVPHRKQTRDYNLPRHAGSVYGLFAFAQAAHREPAFAPAAERALEAGLRAISFVGDNLKSPLPQEKPDLRCFLAKGGRSKSGSTALAALALVALPTPGQVQRPDLKRQIEQLPLDQWYRGMGLCLLSTIDKDGKVFRYFGDSQKSDTVVNEPKYFPGEVMLALTRMYRKLGDEAYREGAERIGQQWLDRYRWALRLNIPLYGDHWIIQATSELSPLVDRPEYAELAVLMATAYVREQHPPQEYVYPDYRGAYRRVVDVPRTTRAASRGEAVGAALHAAQFLGRDTTKFRNSLIEGARHLLEQQFVPETAFYVPQDHDVVGGIRMGIADPHLRIDNNQHALVALIHALEAFDQKSR